MTETKLSAVTRIGAATLFACALAAPAVVCGQGGPPDWRTKANAGPIKAFADQLFAFDEAGRANKGRPPADAKARLQKMQAVAAGAKGEIRAFTARLKAAGEVEAFDRAVMERATQSGSAQLLSELRSAGGAYALLTKGDQYLDEMIADRRKAVEQGGIGSRLSAMAGIAEVHAMKTTLCAAFWFTITLGYGEAHAYRSCYY